MTSRYRCETCDNYKWNGCIALAKDTSLITIVGCVSHSDIQSDRDRVLIELDRLCQLYNEDFTHRDTNTPQKYISQGRSEAYKHAISLVKQLGGEQK